MKNKGFASSIIVFSLLTLFLVTLLVLLTTLNNTSSLNNNVKKSIVNDINYDDSSSSSIENRLTALEKKVTTLESDKVYPVGSVYMSFTDETTSAVAERFGGEWEKIESAFLIGASDAYKVGTTGGTAAHKHESPVNSVSTSSGSLVGVNSKFGTTTTTGGGSYGNANETTSTSDTFTSYYTSEESNIPPYVAVYMYKRTK